MTQTRYQRMHLSTGTEMSIAQRRALLVLVVVMAVIVLASGSTDLGTRDLIRAIVEGSNELIRVDLILPARIP